MFYYCPKCAKKEEQKERKERKNEKVKYLGVSCKNPIYLKIFECEKCTTYYTQEKKTGHKNPKPKELIKREAALLLKERISCPKCQKFKKNKNIRRPPIDSTSVDYEYESVVFVGFLTQKNGIVINRFYCRNHAKIFEKQRYQFRKRDQKEKRMKLKTFIEESTSQYFYTKVRKLYKNRDLKQAHKLEEHKKTFEILYDIGLPQTILATIFHTSQPTIYRYIKENRFTREYDLYIEEKSKAVFRTKAQTAVFLTKVKANDEKIMMNKIYWKRIMTAKN